MIIMPKNKKENSGKWSVEGDNRIYTEGDFRVIFIKMPDIINRNSQNVFEIRVNKSGKEVSRLGLRKYLYPGKPPQYVLLEITPEKDTFTIRNYGAIFQEQEVIASHAIAFYENFEKRILKELDYDQYLEFRRRAVEYLRKFFKLAKYVKIEFCTSYFMLLTFEPKPTKNNYYLTVAYDYKNDRYSILSNMESLKKFLTHNRIELNDGKNVALLSKKNMALVIDLVKFCSINQFKRVIKGFDDILKIKFVTKDNLNEVTTRIQEIKNIVKEPLVKENKLKFYLLHTWFPGELEEWTLVEKDREIHIEVKTIMKQVYVPGFVTLNFGSPEEGMGYIR